jgi:hypothetical protein
VLTSPGDSRRHPLFVRAVLEQARTHGGSAAPWHWPKLCAITLARCMNDGLTHQLQLAGAVLEARARESLDTAQFLQGLPHSHGPHPDSTEFAQHEYALLALPPVSLHSPCLLSTCLLSPCLTGAQRGVPLTGALAGAECRAFEGSLRGVERGDGCSTFAGSRRGVRCCTLAARCSPALPNRPLLSEPRSQGALYRWHKRSQAIILRSASAHSSGGARVTQLALPPALA